MAKQSGNGSPPIVAVPPDNPWPQSELNNEGDPLARLMNGSSGACAWKWGRRTWTPAAPCKREPQAIKDGVPCAQTIRWTCMYKSAIR
jgi:hypothetical protein